MKKTLYILYIIAAIASLVACTEQFADEVLAPSGADDDAFTGEMVHFAAGTTENAVTRAPSTYYMPDANRFVCRMYYKAQTGSDAFDVSGGTDNTAWLKVSGSVGNSLYWNKNYADVNTSIKGVGGVDDYGNDFAAPAFYWQNRKEHAFLAWTDLNHATSMVGGGAAGTLCSNGPHTYTKKIGDVTYEYPCNAFDLTRYPRMDGDGNIIKDGEGNIVYNINSITEQPDIAQALTIQAPTGASQEANRVNLYFKHQFSQVQVNIKNAADNSVEIEAKDIEKVELLGVTEEGYVFTELDEDGKVLKTTYKAIDFSKYSEAELKDNRYGTAFDMFIMPTPEEGFKKSFNCITFGQLQAIRITWDENSTGIKHVATFTIPDTKLVNLESGMKYIWNIEIRRGALAVIRTEIIDWELPTEAQYNGSTDGTIVN